MKQRHVLKLNCLYHWIKGEVKNHGVPEYRSGKSEEGGLNHQA